MQHPVVVITGASSGIGRAAARAFAREGARVVLAARRENVLHETARECRRLGAASTLVVPTDVSQAQAVDALAARAFSEFGCIDVWINNAAVLMLGRVEDAPLASFERVMAVNFYGYLHGARAALRYFRHQRAGILINTASILGFVGWPYAGAYVASKYAVRGLSECLREEVRDVPGIHVCTVMPATMDTPIFQRAANYTPHIPRAVPPVYDPARVARAMVRLSRRPARETIVGEFGWFVRAARTLAPGVTERVIAWLAPKLQFDRSTARDSDLPAEGNAFTPTYDGYSVTGGWRRPRAGVIAISAVVGIGAVIAGIALRRLK